VQLRLGGKWDVFRSWLKISKHKILFFYDAKLQRNFCARRKRNLSKNQDIIKIELCWFKVSNASKIPWISYMYFNQSRCEKRWFWSEQKQFQANPRRNCKNLPTFMIFSGFRAVQNVNIV
jgi:hypothetical protein